MAAVEGIDDGPVTQWFVEHIEGVAPPLTFELVAGGRSNLTYRVTDANGTKYVLRRPPISHVLASAHDMGREHKIIAALNGTAVPVPPALGYCTDESVNQRPFYVMAFVEGHIVRDTATAEKVFDEGQRRRAGESLVEVMAAIHAVDPDAVGLGDLGKKEDYIARQLKRWYGQFQQSNELMGRPIPEMHELHDFFAGRIPEQGPAAIVHGDYRLDNTMLGDDGNVAAVLDWELCTLGDPLADVGLLMVYWSDPDDTNPALLVAPTALPGFPRKADLRARYEQVSGRDLSELDFYVAFGYWKLAAILEGVAARYGAGAMGGDTSAAEGFGMQVVNLARQAQAAADRL